MFTVPDDAQTISWSHRRTLSGTLYQPRIWNGTSEGNLQTNVHAPASWARVTFNISTWRGQTVALRFKTVFDGVAFDSIRVDNVIPEWENVGAPSAVPEIVSGPTGEFAEVNGTHFTLGALHHTD